MHPRNYTLGCIISCVQFSDIKCLIRQSILIKKFISKTEQILGCTFQQFKEHLESKFEPWMNWENRGLYNGTENYGWDIDHIIPISTAKTEEEIYKLNHYSNLRPLCSYKNRVLWRENQSDNLESK